ncbi:hypothetical protein HYS91_04125 [Candidatus Daviesbacteria bacterium]|nr:hypothetical protein [Candidatus Daviesbacteria bacterium]
MPRKKSTSRKKETQAENLSELDSSEKNFSFFKNKKFLIRRKALLIHRKFFVLGFLILILLVVFYFLYKVLVFAFVDGKPLTNIQYFQKLKSLETQSGLNVREQMIVERIIESEKQKQNISISDEDLNKALAKEEELGGGKEAFEQSLSIQGIDKDLFREYILKPQLLKEKLFGKDAAVSEKQVDDYITSIQKQQEEAGQEVSEVDEKMKSQIRISLRKQKIDQKYNDWLKQILESNRIIYLYK